MSIWKSPVFYFGIVLVLAVVAALAAPFVVPWNNYRSDLQAFGQKLTGRQVSIGGDIAVRLFPWPQLEARDVAIGNPTGFSEGAFIKADVLRVKLALGGLFSGRLDVESVEVLSPQVNLQRTAQGDVNWFLAPQEQVAGQGLLSRVKLDQITLQNGIVSYDDLRNGQSTVFTGLTATLSAQSIRGPWRARGEGKWNELPLSLTVTTNAKEDGKPLTFTTKFTPSDTTFPNATVDGSWDGAAFKGAIRIDPQGTSGEKASAEGTFKPLAVQAQVEASSQRMSLVKLRIAPADRKDNGTLIEGDAIVEFGTESRAAVDLRSPRINLDTLIGSSALQRWRDGGFLAVANQLLKIMPARLVTEFKLNVNVLTSGGQTLNDMRLTGRIQKEAIRVHEFSADLPGRSSARFDGSVFPGKTAAQLGGKFTFESADTRAFVGWLVPSWQSAIATHWTGARGRLQVDSGTIDWTKDRFSLAKVGYLFEGAAGRASLVYERSPQLALTVNVEHEAVDFDSLVPQGWSIIRDGGLPGLIASLVKPAPESKATHHLALRANSILLNGVTANAVTLDVSTRAAGLEIKNFDIGNVGGARLHGEGALIDKGDGPEGELAFKLEASDPRGFLRLAGLDTAAHDAMQSLGQTSVDATIKAVPQKSGPEIEVVARGTSGSIKLDVKAMASELENGRNAKVRASGRFASADSAVLGQLANLKGGDTAGPAELVFDLNGSMQDGFAVATRLDAFKAKASFTGTAQLAESFFGLSGKIESKADDGQMVLQALGVPVPQQVGQPMDLRTLVAVKEGALSFFDMTGNMAGHRFSGTAQVSRGKEVQADFETDTLEIKEALALAFMPWTGVDPDLSQGFAKPGDSTWSGAVFVRPLQFDPLTAAAQKEVVVGFGFDAGQRMLTVTSPGELGIKADITVKPVAASYAITGTLRWPVDVAKPLATADGNALAAGNLILQGAFNGSGRSPSAALATTEGKGNFWLSNARLPRLTLEGFARGVLAAASPDDLSRVLARLDMPPGIALGQSIGNFTMSNGNLVFSDLAPPVDGLTVTIAPQMDMAAGQIKVSTTVAIKGKPELPAVHIDYGGDPAALTVRNGTSALAAKLGYELLSKEMAELEKLQQEQQALAVKEEAQRLDDERRFADYQATRAELREQTRTRRFHAAERARQAALLKAISDEAIKTGPSSGKIDLIRHARRIVIHTSPAPPQP